VTVYREEETTSASTEALSTLLERDSQAIWVDLDRGRPEDLRVLSEVLHFHPLAIEDAQKTEQRPKVESYDGFLFITVHAARYDRAGQVALDEIDIFFTRRAVVTVRAAGLAAMDEARARLAKAPGRLCRSSDFVLYTILDTAVDTYFPVLDRIDDHIERLEDHIFKRQTTRTLNSLFRAKRALLHSRRHVVPLRDTLNVLMRREAGLINEQMIVYFRDIYDHVLRITDQIDTHRDLITGTLEIYLSLVSNRLNEVMKVLTVITAIVGPLAVITGIYGMNFERPFPAFDWPYGFGLTIGVMAVIVVGMLILFRRRGYL
jgi:magnesium transporter